MTILSIIIAAISAQAGTDYQLLLHKTHAERFPYLAGLYHEFVMPVDTVRSQRLINELRDFAIKHKDKELETEADLLYVYFLTVRKSTRVELVLQEAEKLSNDLDKKGETVFKVRLLSIMGDYYWVYRKNYELAFDQLLEGYELFREMDTRTFPDKTYHLHRLGECYYFFRDYRNSIRFMKEALAASNIKYARLIPLQALNTLGLCYQHLGELDSSDYYFKRVSDEALNSSNVAWHGISAGNLGQNLFLRGRYEAAVPYLQQDVAASIAREDWSCASGSQMTLAAILLKQNNPAGAAAMLGLAREWVYRSGEYDRLKTLYPLLSKLAGRQGDASLAAIYLDSALFVTDSIARKYNALQLLRAQQKSEMLRHRAEMAGLESQKKIKLLQRNILIVVVLLLFLTSVYLYQQQRRKNERKRLLLDMQLRNTEQELVIASARLDEFARSISEKNRLLEELEARVGSADTGLLAELHEKTILTEEEWKRFRQLFEQVHTGYLGRLKDKLPGLTPAEVRFMALAKMQLSNKEMASALGISTQAVRTTWYRMRRKLELSEESTLEELVTQI